MNRFFTRIASLLALALWLPACAHYHGGGYYGYGHPRGWGGYHAYPRHGGEYYGYARPDRYGQVHPHEHAPDRWYGYRPPEHHRPPYPGFGHWNGPPAPFGAFADRHGHRDGGAWQGHGMRGRENRHHSELGPPDRRLNRQEARMDRRFHRHPD